MFTGHEFDSETTYDYHGARYYNRELGRYMSVDPLAMKFFGWSTYNYVMGNPIMLIDPTGKAPEDWIGKKDANGNTTWEWDPNVDGPDKLPSGYTEYAKPGDKYLSQDYDSEGNQRWVKLGHGKDKWSYVTGDVNNQGMPIDNDYTEQGLAAQRLHEKLMANHAALEGFFTDIFLGVATLPFGGGGGLLARSAATALINGSVNLTGQLMANNWNFKKVDVLGVGIATTSGLIGGKPILNALGSAGIDAIFDYSQSDGFKTIVGNNKKSFQRVGNDFLWNGLGNLGASSFGKNPILFETVGTAVTGVPTNVINTITNDNIFPELKK